MRGPVEGRPLRLLAAAAQPGAGRLRPDRQAQAGRPRRRPHRPRRHHVQQPDLRGRRPLEELPRPDRADAGRLRQGRRRSVRHRDRAPTAVHRRGQPVGGRRAGTAARPAAPGPAAPAAPGATAAEARPGRIAPASIDPDTGRGRLGGATAGGRAGEAIYANPTELVSARGRRRAHLRLRSPSPSCSRWCWCPACYVACRARTSTSGASRMTGTGRAPSPRCSSSPRRRGRRPRPAPRAAGGAGDGVDGTAATRRTATAWHRRPRRCTRVFTNADGTHHDVPELTRRDGHRRPHHRTCAAASGSDRLDGRPAQRRPRQPARTARTGCNQEYPVVIMQCRGTDDPTCRPTQQLAPETCWTAVGRAALPGRRGRRARPPGRTTSTPTAADKAAGCRASTRSRRRRTARPPTSRRTSRTSTPFAAAKGTVFPACDADSMPPEAAVGAAFPAGRDRRLHRRRRQRHGAVRGPQRRRERVAGLQPRGRLLGRRDPDRRALLRPAVVAADDRPTRPAARPAASSPGRATSPTRVSTHAVSPALWWSASNWRNRFSIPITFGLPPDTCDVLDPRAADRLLRLGAAGPGGAAVVPGVLPGQGALQVPAQPDVRRGRLEPDGDRRWSAPRSSPRAHEPRGADPVGYAPTAVTGFSDRLRHRPARQRRASYTDLRLNAAAAGQAAHPVLPRLRPRSRAPRHRRQPAVDQHSTRSSSSSTPASSRPRQEAGGDAAVAVELLRRASSS